MQQLLSILNEVTYTRREELKKFAEEFNKKLKDSEDNVKKVF